MPWRWRKDREDDLDRELRSWLELSADEFEEGGMTREQAVHAARKAFGSSVRVKEDVRNLWLWNRLEFIFHDLRHALHNLLASPGFTIAALLTLAIGIGAGTAIFTLLNAVVLRPLPFPASSELVVVWERIGKWSLDSTGPNPRHADLWNRQSQSFSGMALLRTTSTGVTLGLDHPVVTGAVLSSTNIFDVLRIRPAMGRAFLPEEDIAGHDDVAILTWPLWQTLFGGDRNVLGKQVRVGDKRRRIIGVLPPEFRFPSESALRAFHSKQPVAGAPEPGIFIPAALDLNTFSWSGEYGNWIALARLKPGSIATQVESQLNALAAHMNVRVERRPDGALDINVSLESLQRAVTGEPAKVIWFLMAAVLGLMLIACVNLANTQLGRALYRQREGAVRAALGAARWRLLWNSLAENLLLAIGGGSAGLALASVALTLFRRYSPVDVPRLADAHIDVNVLLFAGGLTITSMMLFAGLPVLRALRLNPQTALQNHTARAHGGVQAGRLRFWLIGFQVFGCTLLLVITGLFAKSLLHLLIEDKGFETHDAALAEVRLGRAYTSGAHPTAFDDAVLQNLRDLPGAQSAGLVSAMPLEGEIWIDGVQRKDGPHAGQEGSESLVNLRWVSPGYFESMRERLVAGRFFNETDRNTENAVLSEGLAKYLWPNENPLGGQFLTGSGKTCTIIGVVADSRNASLKSAPPRMVYLHYAEKPPSTVAFVVRGSQPAGLLLSGMRQAIWKFAPDVTIVRVKTLDSQLSDSIARERLETWLMIAFGAAALLLAMLGIYGVVSYSTAARIQEIGVRIALGATRRLIYALTLAEAGIPVLAGLLAGLLASGLAGHALEKLIYGSKAVDPVVMLAVAALFLSAALLAVILPARRAVSVDPMQALRCE
jgi:predicted permease